MAHPRAPTLTAVVAALLLPAAGLSQEIPSPYRHIERGQEGGAIVGYMDADPGRFGFGPKGAAFWGAWYGVNVSGPISLEGVATFMPTERVVVNPRRVEGDRALPDPAEVNLVNLNARLRFNLTGRRTWNRLQPYAAVGAGIIFDAQGRQAEDQRLEEDERFDLGTQFAGVFGGGFRALITDRIAVRGEAAISLYQVDVPDGWRDPDLGLGDSPESEWVSAPTFTLGASLLF